MPCEAPVTSATFSLLLTTMLLMLASAGRFRSWHRSSVARMPGEATKRVRFSASPDSPRATRDGLTSARMRGKYARPDGIVEAI